jgi:hypothetical protein
VWGFVSADDRLNVTGVFDGAVSAWQNPVSRKQRPRVAETRSNGVLCASTPGSRRRDRHWCPCRRQLIGNKSQVLVPKVFDHVITSAARAFLTSAEEDLSSEKIARLLTALREAKEDIENNDEAGAYLIIKNTLNPSSPRSATGASKDRQH